MENEKIQNGIEEIQNIKMTTEEKGAILGNILSSPVQITKPIKSPYSFISIFQKNQFAYVGMVLLLVIILGGGEIYFKNQAGQNTGNLATIQNPRQINGIGQENQNIQNRDFSTNSINPSQGINPSSTNIPPSNTNYGGVSSVGPTAMMAPTVGGVKENPNYTNITSVVFTDWLKQQAQRNGGMLDYKINNITLVILKATAQGQDLAYFSANTTNNAFIVSVNYSVQSNPENIIYWEAGNGTIGTEGWILNKSLYLTIDKNNNGYFVQNAGTGL